MPPPHRVIHGSLFPPLDVDFEETTMKIFEAQRCSTIFPGSSIFAGSKFKRSVNVSVFYNRECVRGKKPKIPQNSKMRYIFERQQLKSPSPCSLLNVNLNFSQFLFLFKIPLKKNKKKTAKSQFPDAHYNVFHYCINSSQEEPKSFEDGLEIN